MLMSSASSYWKATELQLCREHCRPSQCCYADGKLEYLSREARERFLAYEQREELAVRGRRTGS